MFHLRTRHKSNRRQEGPLIQMRRTRFVDELAVARTSREPLKRQGNQVAEATRWHGILTRKKSIVGSESDIGEAFHRVGNQEASATARQYLWNRLSKENLGVRTVSASGPLNLNRYCMTAARAANSKTISSPLPSDET